MTLKQARKSHGKTMTQAELAKRVGVSQALISACEMGTRRPSPEAAVKIAEVLGLTRDEMWEMFYAKDAG